jgi:hypothetical protein
MHAEERKREFEKRVSLLIWSVHPSDCDSRETMRPLGREEAYRTAPFRGSASRILLSSASNDWLAARQAIPEGRKSMQARLLRETGKKINMDIPSEAAVMDCRRRVRPRHAVCSSSFEI